MPDVRRINANPERYLVVLSSQTILDNAVMSVVEFGFRDCKLRWVCNRHKDKEDCECVAAVLAYREAAGMGDDS